MTVVLQKEGKEKLAASVAASADPTAVDPAWDFKDDSTERPDDWIDGSWVGTTVALTPTLGGTGSGAGRELSAGKWYPWIKIEAAGEVIVRQLKPFTMKG